MLQREAEPIPPSNNASRALAPPSSLLNLPDDYSPLAEARPDLTRTRHDPSWSRCHAIVCLCPSQLRHAAPMPHGGAVQNKPWNAGTKPNNGTGNSVLTASVESIPFPSAPGHIHFQRRLDDGKYVSLRLRPAAGHPPTLPWAAAKLKRKCPMTLRDRPRLELGTRSTSATSK